MAYFGPPSYQDPDEAREWALDRANDPEWRPPVEDDGQQVAKPCVRCVERLGRAPVPVPADPMPVYGLELPEGES
mgnify:FL=1